MGIKKAESFVRDVVAAVTIIVIGVGSSILLNIATSTNL